MHRTSLAIMLLLVLLLVLPACGGDDRAADGGRHQVHGSFTVGDVTHHFVATYQDSTLLSVIEEQRAGDLSRGRTRYEVLEDRLVSVHTEEQRRAVGNGGPFETVTLELEFDATGQVLRQAKTVDGAPAELLGYEAPGVQRHFGELRERVDQAQRAAAAGL